MKVLIADDHPVVRSGLRQILGAEDDMFIVGEAENGLQTMELVRNVEWDVLVLDYSMPDRNGLDLIKDIKQQYPDRPVLVLSMMPEEVHAAQVYKAGGSGFVKKDTAADELTVAIRKVTNGRKYVSPTFAERLASGLTNNSSERPLHESLTDREYRVMWLLASGRKIKEIARELHLSPSTVSTYRTRILRKLTLADNAALIRYAISHQLV
ncbi:MAG: response regulator transcription factor [Betaproteobacteria bacterium]